MQNKVFHYLFFSSFQQYAPPPGCAYVMKRVGENCTLLLDEHITRLTELSRNNEITLSNHGRVEQCKIFARIQNEEKC